ncbi:hypothetical protein P9D77_11075 [Bacillus rugosus]|nr:hypothetical protein [Bacillus rugosus]MEC1548855.1 hypothetical protein [Bacillus rugosus]
MKLTRNKRRRLLLCFVSADCDDKIPSRPVGIPYRKSYIDY